MINITHKKTTLLTFLLLSIICNNVFCGNKQPQLSSCNIILEAIESNDPKELKNLHKKGHTINKLDTFDRECLVEIAIQDNKHEALLALIENGLPLEFVLNSSINLTDHRCLTFLLKKDNRFIKGPDFLINAMNRRIRASEIDKINDRHKYSDMVNHITESKINVAKILLKYGININQINKDKQTALIASIDAYDLECIQFLIEQGAIPFPLEYKKLEEIKKSKHNVDTCRKIVELFNNNEKIHTNKHKLVLFKSFYDFNISYSKQ